MDGLPWEVKIEYIVMNICEWEWRLEKDQIGGGRQEVSEGQNLSESSKNEVSFEKSH